MTYNKLSNILQKETTKIISDRSVVPCHASDLDAPYCARKLYYRHKYPESKIQSSFLTFTFSLGRSIETILRQEYLLDYMFGLWGCGTIYNEGIITRCGEVSPYGKFPYWNCVSCGSYNWVYKEISWVCEELGVSCSFDGFLEIEGQLYLLEIKSMKEDQFKKLTSPLSHHERRTKIYMNCLRYFPDFSIAPIAYIVYCSKSSGVWQGGQVVPFQVFEIPYEDIEKDIIQKVSPYYLSLKTNIPPKRVCVSQQDKQGLVCPFFLRCMTQNGDK